MVSNEQAVAAIVETCAALSNGNVEQAAEIIRTKYPHDPNEKFPRLRKNPPRQLESIRLTNAERIYVCSHDGFIDRYTGERLIFKGTLAVLSTTLPEVFPYQAQWDATKCHQAWKNLGAIAGRIITHGETNRLDNFICIAGRQPEARGIYLLEEITLHERGDLKDWDGMLDWFRHYVEDKKHEKILANKEVKRWYDALKKFLNKHGGILNGRH